MGEFITLFILFVILFIISIFVKKCKVKKTISIISLIILCIVSGTRNVGGTDYYMYKVMFQSIPTNNVIGQMASICNQFQLEKGFYLYMALIKNIGFNYYGYTLVNSVVFYSLFYMVLKRYDYNINFILLLFLYKMFFYNTFISMRQSISIIIFWLSLPLLKDKKYIFYFLTCVFAFFFHRSSIILFVIPFLTHFNISKKNFMILLIIGLISYFLVKIGLFDIKWIIKSVLGFIFKNNDGGLSRLGAYLSDDSGISLFYVIEYYIIAWFVYLYYNRIRDIDENSDFFIKFFICLLPIYTIFNNFSIVTRLKDFFFLAYPFMLIYVSKCLKKNKFLLYTVTIAICFYGYVRYINNFDDGALKNYRSYIFDNVSIYGNNE